MDGMFNGGEDDIDDELMWDFVMRVGPPLLHHHHPRCGIWMAAIRLE